MNEQLQDLVDLIFDTNMEEVMKEKSTLEYINKLQKENKQLKEKIDNVNKYIDDLLEKGIEKNILEAIKYMLGDKE